MKRVWASLEGLASRHALSVALTLRAIGVVSLVAFVSLHVQVIGLFGADGILPMTNTVGFVTSTVMHPMAQLPSVFLVLGGSDTTMLVTCWVGELASVAMIAGVLGGLAPLIAYGAYLSFVSLGSPFVPLQWDTLLTESLAIAVIASPLTLARVPFASPRSPHPIALFALWMLIGRLMFASGYVKLASGDEAWRSLTALDFHFETQPLPTLAGYAMHFAPSIFRSFGTLLTFAVELVLPFAIFFGARGRRVAALGFSTLLSIIAITGNYGFFDFLALALAVSLVDDAALARLRLVAVPVAHLGRVRHAVAVLAGAQMMLAVITLLATLGAGTSVPAAIEPFRVANHYGLFAVMTRDRPIVIFEGSDDGETWAQYDYRWQSGDPARAPAACMPHMPRLDWMIWFAGLGGGEAEQWIVATQIGLLRARPDVLALFGTDPFHGHAPRYVRTVRYDYAFAPPGDDDWWMRFDRAPYGPTLERP